MKNNLDQILNGNEKSLEQEKAAWANIEPNLLKNKVAIVTGAGRGIGASIAFLLAKYGANVVINYFHSEKEAISLMNEINQSLPKSVAIKADVRIQKECEKLFEETINQFGKVDILINNAGINDEEEDIENIFQEQLDNTIKTNIYGPFYCLQLAKKHLQENGSIVNLSSIQEKQTNPGSVLYAITKAANSQLSQHLAKDFGKKQININSVAPGPTYTDMYKDSHSIEHMKANAEKTALKRIGRVDDISHVVVYLVSPKFKWITGQTIYATGGYLQ